MLAPLWSARSEEAWIAGPSAMGSLKGIPSSIRSAPAAGSCLTIAAEVLRSGSPAVTKVTKAARPSRFSAAKRASMRFSLTWFHSQLRAQVFRGGENILVAPPAEIGHDQVILGQLRGE